jgi:hypothetical protein
MSAESDAKISDIVEIYSDIREYEQHFNQIQSNYRGLASTWLLATFAGIGFVWSVNYNPVLPADLLIAGIAVAGSLGIFLLWNLDHNVYHGLLDSVFVEGLRLENKHIWLPQVRHNMMRVEESGKTVFFYIFLFYFIPQIVLYGIASWSIYMWLDGSYFELRTLVILLPLIIMLSILYYMHKTSNRSKENFKSLVKERSHEVDPLLHENILEKREKE